MRYLLRNKDTHVIHDCVQEGGGTMIIMMSKCGLYVRWDLSHPRWERAKVEPGSKHEAHVSCRKCLGN